MQAALLLAVVAAGVAIASNRPLSVEVAVISRDVPVRVYGLGTAAEARFLSKVGFEAAPRS